MSFDLNDLQTTLGQAYAAYRANPEKAVRSGKFIGPIHAFCARELERLGLIPENLVPHPEEGGYLSPTLRRFTSGLRGRVTARLRATQLSVSRKQVLGDLDTEVDAARRRRLRVLGGYMEKEIDVCYIVEDTGPLLAVSVKSQMSSIAKNTINRFEEYVGDATNLHTRYPMLVLGFLLLVPVNEETFRGGEPTDALLRVTRLLEQAAGRVDPSGTPGSYEACALLVVDFASDPPVIHPDVPGKASPLRIERLFQSLVELYRRRNQTIQDNA